MQVCRVPVGMVCSSFLLAGTIKFHLKQFGTPVSHLKLSVKLYNNYVDNVMLGATSVEDTYSIYVES